MIERKLRDEVLSIIQNIERENRRLEELAYEIWKCENENLSESYVRSIGYKAVLRQLGYVI